MDRGPLSPLRAVPAFRALWIGRVTSFAGDQLTLVALTLHVHAVHGTGGAVAMLLFAGAAPRLLGPIAGAIADRTEQRRLMRACELVRAGVIVTIAATLPALPLLLGLVAVAALSSTLFMPAGRSAVPVLVPGRALGKANALLATGHNVGLALGPVLGGALVAWVGVPGALTVDALTSLLAAVVLGRLPSLRPTGSDREHTARLSADVREGLRVVSRHPTARRVLVGLLLGVTFAGVGDVAGVFLVRDVLGGGPLAFGAFTAAWGVGMIAGSLFLAWWGDRLDAARTFALGWTLTGGGMVGAGVAPGVAVAVGAYGVGGVGNGVENVATDTLLQRAVPRRYLGRVFGAVYTGAVVGELIAYAVTGPLLEVVPSRVAFVAAGVATATVAVWLLRALPSSDGLGGRA